MILGLARETRVEKTSLALEVAFVNITGRSCSGLLAALHTLSGPGPLRLHGASLTVINLSQINQAGINRADHVNTNAVRAIVFHSEDIATAA
jgi:hypothetical protein